jgi:hypothetical protein
VFDNSLIHPYSSIFDEKGRLFFLLREYTRLLKGADLILMLSSMLHSIGVGNMTPAGVKLVCVDINPAVVTKLSDRGSMESVGVVTDVGLFLNLLTQLLKKLELDRAESKSAGESSKA